MNDYELNILNKAVSVVSGLLVSVILARYLGVALRGDFAFITQVSAVAAIVVGLGVNHAFIFQYRRGQLSTTFAQASGLLLMQGVCFALIAGTCALVLRDPTAAYVTVLTATLALYQQFESMMAAYDVRLKIRVNIFYAATRLVAHVVMWLLSAANLIWPVVISVAVALLAVGLYLSAAPAWPRWPNLISVRKFIGFGWLPMLTTLLVVLNYSVDVILLKILGNPTDLGLYAVAAGIITYLWVLPDAVKEVLVSRVVRTNDIRSALKPLKASLLAGVGSVAGVVMVGYPAIALLFGKEFTGAYILVVILSIGVLPMIYYKVLGVVVLAEGRRGFYFASLALAVALNVVLNWYAIPVFGAVGAAWTSVASYAVTGFMFVVYFGRLSGISLANVLLVGPQDIKELWTMWRRHS